jgi:cobalt-zinc-cadmium efflux system outer membrane protein
MTRAIAIACLAIGLQAPAWAQDIMTEARFLARVGPDHAAVVGHGDRLAEATGEAARAGRLENPSVDWWREAPDGEPVVTNWTFGWTPPLDGRRGLRVKAARADLAAASSDLEAHRLALRHRLRAVYADWALGVARLRVAGAGRDSLEAMARRMRARADSGEESKLTARRLELAAVETRAGLAVVEAEAARGRAAALAWLEGDAGVPELPDLPEAPATLEASDRPDLAALRHEAEAEDFRARLGGRFLSFPRLSVGWQRLGDGASDTDGPLLGVSWPIPLFDRNQGDAREARLKRDAALARAELAERLAAAERAGALAAYATLRHEALATRAIAEDAGRAVDGATAAYRLGEGSLTDLLDTMRSAAAARLAALDLYAAALQAHRDLELAVGRELPAEGGSR